MADSNCPNCGAPAKGLACEYCGTPLESPEKALQLAIGKTVSVSFEHEGRLYEFDMLLEHVDLNMCGTTLYADNVPCTMLTPDCEATLGGRLVPSEKMGRECLCMARELSPEEMTQ